MTKIAEPDPYPLVRDMDPRIQIHIKMPWIRNTASVENYTLLCVRKFILIFSIGARIFVTEFSPFEWSSNLLAVGLANSVLIGQIRLPEEDDSCKVGMHCEELL